MWMWGDTGGAGVAAEVWRKPTLSHVLPAPPAVLWAHTHIDYKPN